MAGPDLYEVIQEYLDTKEFYSFEGERGVTKFETLVNDLGYGTIEEFLADNPGAIDTIIDWIADTGINEWRDKLSRTIKRNTKQKD